MKIKSIMAVVFVIVICSIWLLNFLTFVPSLETSEFSNIKQDTDERYLDIYKMDFAALKRIDFARFFSKLFLMIESQKFDYRFMSTRKFQNYFIFFSVLLMISSLRIFQSKHQRKFIFLVKDKLWYQLDFRFYLFSHLEFWINIPHQAADSLSWSLPQLWTSCDDQCSEFSWWSTWRGSKTLGEGLVQL